MLFRIKILFLYFLFLISAHSILLGENDSFKDEILKPLLLPNSHPVKGKLDKIFSESRASLNLETLTKAGFKKSKPRNITKIVVTNHSSMPGYIFKLYLDSQGEFVEGAELEYLLKRIEGANIVRKVIADYGLGSFFSVPQKWIYKIPSHHLPPLGCIQRRYLLVVEDMNIYSKSKNMKIWKSNKVTYDLLDKLYLILKESCLSDCAKPSNIPFTIDGRIAFIDTQNYNYPIIDYDRLEPYLSKKNRSYWKSITQLTN